MFNFRKNWLNYSKIVMDENLKVIKNDNKKNIGFVARGLTKGGVTRFIVNILEQFNNNNNNKYNFYVFTDRKDFQKRFRNLKVIYIKKSNKLYWDYIKSFFVIKKYSLDVIFYPKNVIPLTHIFIKTKKINIIHDLAYYNKKLNAYKLLDTIYMGLFIKTSCIISNKIIAVSKNTKKDIVNILKVKSDKIKIVYEGVEKKFKKENRKEKIKPILKKYNIKKPFLFYCGSLSPRKNILRALEAFNQIKKDIPHNIYLVSGKSWNDKNIFDYIKINLSDRVFNLGYLTEEELIVFYSEADLFLYPSLYEGFGLPILEAQICECPVLTSDTASCPEIAGKGAHIVNPYSIEEIQDGILKVLQNKNYRFNLIAEGKENVKRFSWKKSCNDILKLI